MVLSSNPNMVCQMKLVLTTSLTFVLGSPTGFVRSGLLLMCFKRKKENDLTVYSHCQTVCTQNNQNDFGIKEQED